MFAYATCGACVCKLVGRSVLTPTAALGERRIAVQSSGCICYVERVYQSLIAQTVFRDTLQCSLAVDLLFCKTYRDRDKYAENFSFGLCHMLIIIIISTGIGDHLWRVYYPGISRPLRPTQPGHPSVGRCNVYWRRFRPPLAKKRRVMRSSWPYYKDCWHILA